MQRVYEKVTLRRRHTGMETDLNTSGAVYEKSNTLQETHRYENMEACMCHRQRAENGKAKKA